MTCFFTTLKYFIKKETVLSAALFMALISMLFVHPDKQYAAYIDWKTLLLLFSLMAVMAGLKNIGVFNTISITLLKTIKSTRYLILVLTMLPFFFSMLVTNDVALITFVPFAMIVLKAANMEQLTIFVVTLQTIAANLGSMLTPMGNPQNLYLYSKSGMSLADFIMLMLPYTILSGACIMIAFLFIKNRKIDNTLFQKTADVSDTRTGAHHASTKILTACYLAFFFLCLCSVLKLLHPVFPAVSICIFLFVMHREILKKIDYSLLLTFIGFFIFIGNMGRIEGFRSLIQHILTGHEALVAILSSQIISNVPAALLLSGFTESWSALIIGTNLGGLGTLIASMASLISYKQIAREYPTKKGKYLIVFTVSNIFMLIFLYLFYLVIQ